MDEPFSALDVLTARTMRDLVLDLWASPEVPTKSILLVTHSIEEAVSLSDRVVVLKANPGRIAAVGRPAEPAAAAAAPTPPRARSGGPHVRPSGLRRGDMTARHHRSRCRTRPSGWSWACSSTCGRCPGGRRTSTSSADPLGYQLDDLLPVTEAAKRLGLVRIASGDIELTAEGKASPRRRSRSASAAGGGAWSAAPDRRHPPGAGRGRRAGVPRRFLERLREHFSPSESERQLATALDWARYGEMFDFDPDAEEFVLAPSLCYHRRGEAGRFHENDAFGTSAWACCWPARSRAGCSATACWPAAAASPTTCASTPRS